MAVSRLRRKHLVICFGLQLVCLVALARYIGLSVSIHFERKSPTGTRDLEIHPRDCPAQPCSHKQSILSSKQSTSNNQESTPINRESEQYPKNRSVTLHTEDSIDIGKESVGLAQSQAKHFSFQKSVFTCSVVIQGHIPEKAKRIGYEVKDYPRANIDEKTGFYERSPPDTYNSSIEVEELDEKLLKKIKDYVPHLFSTYLPFSPEYRNPCKVVPGRARCLPYFHVLTGAKSGSTDFWYSMELHPLVFTTPKEPHWWTRDVAHSIKPYDKSFSHFQECIETGKDPNIRNYVTGDGSTSSLWDNHLTINWSDSKGWGKYPTVTLADIIRALTPNARIIFLLRNPIERLYSDYFYIYGGRSAQDFDVKVRKHLKVYDDCLKREDQRTCLYRNNRGGVGHSVLVGLYYIYVQDWLKRFPLDQVLFLRSDDWFQGQKPDMLLKTYHFLDIDVTQEEMKDILTIDTLKITIGRENVLRSASGRKKRNPMLPSTKKLLEELYAPSNKALAKLTGNDGFLWKD
ncbi:carbohydrate sulfotransferase 15-like [Acanthaster planci]|uniref:Carbohydrate sulfotransferase 15-like n=1 Tax=Acanthaster planci TaxID=133434 RepID=A0A8B7Y3Q7_ACAPL|nr:carbohydrate sulfotransferase 15-like [Acanthaster planci]